MRQSIQAAVLMYVFALGVGPSLALATPNPISGPITITENGSYVVTQDIAVATPPAIVVQAPNVTIDLNGKTISTPGFDTGSLIVMDPDAEQLWIRNGSVQGGGYYISSLADAVRLKIDRVSFSGGQYGIALTGATSISIRGSSIISERYPIDITGSYPLFFDRNTVSSNEYYNTGIFFSGVMYGSFSLNKVSAVTYQGSFIEFRSTGLLRIAQNEFDGDYGSLGVHLAAGQFVFANNLVKAGHLSGVTVDSSGNLIVNNRIEGGGGISRGIAIAASDNVVVGNVVVDRYVGITVDGTGHTIAGNTVLGSWERGIEVGGSGNSLLWNGVHGAYGYTKGLVLNGDYNGYKSNDLRNNGAEDLEDLGVGNVDVGGNLVDPAPCDDCDVLDLP